MGLPSTDVHTKDHFLGGLLSVLAFDMYLPRRPVTLLVVVNALHLLVELVERERCVNRPNIVLESMPNHAMDIFVFGVGSLIGFCMIKRAASSGGVAGVVHKRVGELAGVLLFAVQAKLGYEFLREILREIYPNADSCLLEGAFTQNCYNHDDD